MRFIKFFRYDLHCGIVKFYIKYFLFLLFIMLAFLEFRAVITSFDKINFSFADCLLYIYGGVKEYTPSIIDPFFVPYLWLLNHLLILYFSLNYMHRDLRGFGQQTIYRSGSRNLWWCSKCLWQITLVVSFYLLAGVVLFVMVIVSNGDISLEVSAFMPDIIDIGEKSNMNYNLNLQLEIILMPMFFTAATGLFQMMLCLFLKPVFSYIISSVICVSSTYYLSPFFIGNYAMAIRNDKLVSNGINTTVGIIAFTVIAVFSVFVGLIRFRKYDILAKG